MIYSRIGNRHSFYYTIKIFFYKRRVVLQCADVHEFGFFNLTATFIRFNLDSFICHCYYA